MANSLPGLCGENKHKCQVLRWSRTARMGQIHIQLLTRYTLHAYAEIV
jgi:hypothetical protein